LCVSRKREEEEEARSDQQGFRSFHGCSDLVPDCTKRALGTSSREE
jgi:hypothetical protein